MSECEKDDDGRRTLETQCGIETVVDVMEADQNAVAGP